MEQEVTHSSVPLVVWGIPLEVCRDLRAIGNVFIMFNPMLFVLNMF